MSKTLIIRHLPTNLSFQDKQQLLKHFGAENVWESASRRNYVFASFSTKEKAETVLRRLHQLEMAGRRLTVEYSFKKEPCLDEKKGLEETSLSTQKLRAFLREINAWNPSVDFYQPPPVHLKYKYCCLEPKIAINIIFSMFKHKPFYIQVMHLMNKMCLDVPYSDNPEAVSFFQKSFQQFFSNQNCFLNKTVSDSESEIDSDEESNIPKEMIVSTIAKRQHTLPILRKRPAAVLSTTSVPKAKRTPINQAEVFDVVAPVTESKKIFLVVHQDALQKPMEQPEVIGELGTFKKEKKPSEEEHTQTVEEQPAITRKELLKNRISYSDMKLLSAFKNYVPGQPSMRLYIKNLARTATEQDVKRIYKQYIENLSEEEQNSFDVRVMQEGRMKGQAFVTFPSLKIAETALNETNGFLLKDRPIVVQFARAANKKTG